MTYTQTRTIITDFKTLLNEIGYSWEYPGHDIIDHEDGTYSINKLDIGPTEIQYKTDITDITPTVYTDFVRFVKFLKSTDNGLDRAKFMAQVKDDGKIYKRKGRLK